MTSPIAMFEIVSEQPDRALGFYRDLFGWTAGPSFDGYTLVDTGAGDDGVGGGFGPSYEPGDTGVKVYVKVDDLATSIARARDLGGTELVPPTDLPEGYGTFAVVTDLDGNPVGLWA